MSVLSTHRDHTESDNAQKDISESSKQLLIYIHRQTILYYNSALQKSICNSWLDMEIQCGP